MKIDWTALGLDAVVSITITLAFVVLLAFGIRLVSASNAHVGRSTSGMVNQAAGYLMLGLAAALVLLGLYLIVPQFH
jgi:hypothetical protein